MLKLRVAQHVYHPLILRCVTYSSNNNQDHSNNSQQVDNEDKIMTEKFRTLRPLIQDRDVKLEGKILSILETQQGPWNNEVTNISGTRSEEEKLRAKENSVGDTTSSTNNSTNKSGQDILNCSQTLGSLNLESNNILNLNNPSPELMKNNENDSMNQADLSMVGLPLTLHRKDENLLVTAIVQDLHQMYINTADTAGDYYLIAHQHGHRLYTTLKMSLQKQEKLRNFSLTRKIFFTSLTKKAEIFLTEDKKGSSPDSPPAKDVKGSEQSESVLDKVSKHIQNAINNLMEMVQEKKKSMQEKK